jgi:hypothetical protein
MKLPNRLPPSPSRSRGGYLDYAEWPDRERFIELGCPLREADYAGTKWKERRTALSFVEIISGLEDMPALAWGNVRP